MKGKVDIGTRIEIFVSDWLIEKMDNTVLKLHHPIKKEIVMQLNQPWEGSTSYYFTVFKDCEKIRFYYRASSTNIGGSDNDRIPLTRYAESYDGIVFERPNVELFEFNNSKK